MPRDIRISDERGRDAKVGLLGPKKPPARRIVGPGGSSVTYAALVKVPEGRDYATLLKKHGDDAALAAALVAGDPELDLDVMGRRVGPADRVWVRQDGSLLYAERVLEVVLGPDGTERERKDFVDVEATVGDDPLPWSGRLFPIDEVVRRFVLTRRLQLRHVDGLTYEFLFELARGLHEKRQMLFVGAGGRAQKPLIFQRNGSPYRGFLSGRVEGDGYVLALHLSNMELKKPSVISQNSAQSGAAKSGGDS